jgi:hypothetical protein
MPRYRQSRPWREIPHTPSKVGKIHFHQRLPPSHLLPFSMGERWHHTSASPVSCTTASPASCFPASPASQQHLHHSGTASQRCARHILRTGAWLDDFPRLDINRAWFFFVSASKSSTARQDRSILLIRQRRRKTDVWRSIRNAINQKLVIMPIMTVYFSGRRHFSTIGARKAVAP